MNEQFDPRPISKVARNERRKLMATTVNTVGLTIFGVGAVTPLVTSDQPDGSILTFALFTAILLAFHAVARRFLKGLED